MVGIAHDAIFFKKILTKKVFVDEKSRQDKTEGPQI